MFGKLFESTFTGSMAGSGATLFAVWSYIIANTRKSAVELNPLLVGALIGEPAEDVQQAINKLCEPDPNSRSKEHEGRRLIREGQFLYHVVNYAKYRSTLNEDDRREYFRDKKRESRARKTPSNALSNVSTQAEACTVRTSTDVRTESEAEAVTVKTVKDIRPPRPQSIIQPRRKDAAWEGPKVYVPQRAHRDFVALKNGDEKLLLDWYEAVSIEWTDGVHKSDEVGGDMFAFWRNRYSEKWPAAAAIRNSNGNAGGRTGAPPKGKYDGITES